MNKLPYNSGVNEFLFKKWYKLGSWYFINKVNKLKQHCKLRNSLIKKKFLKIIFLIH